jgi:hypothetical protein
MTAAAAPVMHGPDGMRLFLAAAPAAIIAALLAAASIDGNTSPAAKALAPGQPGDTPGTPAGWPHLSPAQAPRVRAGRREAVPGRYFHPAGILLVAPVRCARTAFRTPRMAGCQHGMRQADVVLVFSFPFVTRRTAMSISRRLS